MRSRAVLVGLACLCGALPSAETAEASYDPVAGGTTKLTLDRGFARLLAANGVTVSVKSGARRQGPSLLLPVAGGSLDPEAERGEIQNGGTVLFKRGRRRVVVRRIEVKTKREPLVAKVGGSQLKVASAGRRVFERSGFGSLIAAGPLRLTTKFATRLDKKLRLRGVFEAGQRLGNLRTEAQPGTLAVLPVGRATLVPDPEFLAKLDSLFVSLNPIAPAERGAGPVYTVPLIPLGIISPDAAAGVVRTGGALELLQLGSGQIFWRELWLDLGGHQLLAEVDLQPSPTLPGRIGQVAIASLAVGSVATDPAARAVTLAGVPLALTVAGADQLNLAFGGGEARFQPGEVLGSFTFTASTQ